MRRAPARCRTRPGELRRTGGGVVLVLAVGVLSLPAGAWAADQAPSALSPALWRATPSSLERTEPGLAEEPLPVPPAARAALGLADGERPGQPLQAWPAAPGAEADPILFERTWTRRPALVSTLVVRTLEDRRRSPAPPGPSTLNQVVEAEDVAAVVGIRLQF